MQECDLQQVGQYQFRSNYITFGLERRISVNKGLQFLVPCCPLCLFQSTFLTPRRRVFAFRGRNVLMSRCAEITLTFLPSAEEDRMQLAHIRETGAGLSGARSAPWRPGHAAALPQSQWNRVWGSFNDPDLLGTICLFKRVIHKEILH